MTKTIFLYLYSCKINERPRPYMENNLIIDKKQKIKIPQNERLNYSINEYAEWKYAIQIKFSLTKPLNYLNLFLIIKSYVLNNKIPPHALCTVFKKENQNIITQKENVSWFIGADYYAFCEWINFRVLSDKKYNESEQFYSLVLLFPKGLLLLKNKEEGITNILRLLKPNYPWNIPCLDFFKHSIDAIALLQEKIKFYEKTIKK